MSYAVAMNGDNPDTRIIEKITEIQVHVKISQFITLLLNPAYHLTSGVQFN